MRGARPDDHKVTNVNLYSSNGHLRDEVPARVGLGCTITHTSWFGR